MPKHFAFIALISLAVILCMVPVAGCGGGAQATQPTPTPTGPTPGSQFVYVNSTNSLQNPFTNPPVSPTPSLGVMSLDPTTGTLGPIVGALPITSFSCPGTVGCSTAAPDVPIIGPFPNMNFPESIPSMFSAPNGKYLYFETGGTDLLSFSIGSEGLLKPVSSAYPFVMQTTNGDPTGSAMDSLGRFIYISNESNQILDENQISLFQLDSSTGTITQGQTLSDTSALLLTVETSDPAGNYLYAWNNSPGGDLGISVYKIDAATGALIEIPGSPFPVATSASNWTSLDSVEFLGTEFVMSPSGNFAYANVMNYTNFESDSAVEWDLYAFAINPATGALTTLAEYPMPTDTSAPQAMVMHPNGKFLYVSLDLGTTSGISTFAVDPVTGAFNPTAISFVPDTYCCSALYMSQSGNLLFDEGPFQRYGGWHSFTVDGSSGLLTSASAVNLSSDAFNVGPAAIVVIP